MHNDVGPAHSLSSQELKCICLRINVFFAPILLQKSFSGDERNFLGLLMRFVCGDVRVLIVSYENDHGPSHRRYRALQRERYLKIRFRVLQQYLPQADIISPERGVEANGAGPTQRSLRSCVIGRISKHSEMPRC